MKGASCSLVLTLFLKILRVENRMLPGSYILTSSTTKMQEDGNETGPPEDKFLDVKDDSIYSKASQIDGGDDVYTFGDNTYFEKEEKCSVLVMANQGHTNMQQSLLRKYRYNQAGELIPGSVQYFIKLPQGRETLLVPLKDKAFSPSGGFIRYYKEVPPIPQSWRR